MTEVKKNLLIEENPFLSLEISQMFVEFGLDFLYIKDFDILFAVSTIEFPNVENPFVRFTGFNINSFRVSLFNEIQMRNKLKKRINMPFSEFRFQGNDWFYFKDKFVVENLNKKF